MKAGFFVFVVALGLSWPAANRLQPVITVIDGDTFAIAYPFGLGTEKIRILGMDAPETRRAKCAAERFRGAVAKSGLAALLGAGTVTIERRGLDKYRRTLAVVRVEGVDVAEIMISGGLARPYSGGKRQSWCGFFARDQPGGG